MNTLLPWAFVATLPGLLLTSFGKGPRPGTASLFLKLGARRYLVISIVMVAIAIEPDTRGQIFRARVAVGACSAAAQRLLATELALIGQPIDAGIAALIVPEHLAQVISPIDDVRGSAAYRIDAAFTLVKRGLAEIGGAMRAGIEGKRT